MNPIVRLLCVALLSLPSVAGAVKPSAPLQLAWVLEARQGAVVQLGLRLWGRSEGQPVTLTVNLPEGVRLRSGETRWQGVPEATGSMPLRLVLELGPQARGAVTATAAMELGGARFKTRALWPLAHPVAAAPRALPPRGALRRHQDRWVREYRSRP